MSPKIPHKISFIKYVAYNNTPEARRLIVKFGQMPAKNIQELEARLAYVVKEFKQEALSAIANIHPDKDLILQYAGKSQMTGQHGNGEYVYSNACGCDSHSCNGKCKCKKDEHSNFVTNYRSDVYDPTLGYSGADGSGSTKTPKWVGTGVVIGAIFLLGALIVSAGETQRSY